MSSMYDLGCVHWFLFVQFALKMLLARATAIDTYSKSGASSSSGLVVYLYMHDISWLSVCCDATHASNSMCLVLQLLFKGPQHVYHHELMHACTCNLCSAWDTPQTLIALSW